MSLLILLLSLFNLSFSGVVTKEGIGDPQIHVCATGGCEEALGR